MTEENQELNKPEITKQILKWIGLCLLGLLTIFCIVFRNPLRISILLPVTILVYLILPKPKRKWFWITIASIILACAIWVFLPENSKGWKPYKYDYEDRISAFETKYSVPDSENAALAYMQLIEDVNLPSDLFDMAYRQPWLTKDYPQTAQWLNNNQPLIEKLTEMSKMEKSHYPIDIKTYLEGPFDLSCLDYVMTMRRSVCLLNMSGNNDFAEGRIDDALQKYLVIFRLSDHMFQGTMMSDLFVASALKDLPARQIKYIIINGDLSESQLKQIEEHLDSIPDLPSILVKTTVLDKLGAEAEISQYYEINSKGKIRLSRDPLAQTREHYRKLAKSVGSPLPPLTPLQRSGIKARTLLRWFYIPADPLEAARIIERSYDNHIQQMLKPDYARNYRPFSLSYSNLLLGPYNYKEIYYYFYYIYKRAAADNAGLKILINLKRYKNKNGHWPNSLEEIETPPDPQNGEKFVYKINKDVFGIEDDSFILYSKGINNIDDNGKNSRNWKKTNEPDDWMIWPSKY